TFWVFLGLASGRNVTLGVSSESSPTTPSAGELDAEVHEQPHRAGRGDGARAGRANGQGRPERSGREAVRELPHSRRGEGVLGDGGAEQGGSGRVVQQDADALRLRHAGRTGRGAGRGPRGLSCRAGEWPFVVHFAPDALVVFFRRRHKAEVTHKPEL